MAQGDAARIWFPEMLEELKKSWSSEMTWEQFIDVCGRLSVMCQNIRRAKGIKNLRMSCRKCGDHALASQRVSIGSALFALLQKTNTISETEQKQLYKRWHRFQAKHKLDRYGDAKIKSNAKVALLEGANSMCRSENRA